MPKQPKGTRNRTPDQVEKIQYVIDVLRSAATRRNYKQRDYPVFEQRKYLLQKYGDDEKLIYDLEDQGGGEKLSLRYDLTTQHMLYNPDGRTRTFQMGKVYRRENMSQEQSRYREFWQFDCDLCEYPIPFAYMDIIDMLKDCLTHLEILEKCVIKVNDRKLVNDILKKCDIPPELWNTTCSTIDKFEKFDCKWETVEKELVEKKVVNSDKLIKMLQEDVVYPIIDGLDSGVKWDITMVRGLQYYDGLIFEVVDLKTGKTVGGGGQYGTSIGFSLGLDRIIDVFDISIPSDLKSTSVYLLALGDDMAIHAQNMVADLQVEHEDWNVQVYPIKSQKKIWNAIDKLKVRDHGIAFVYGSSEVENGIDESKGMKF